MIWIVIGITAAFIMSGYGIYLIYESVFVHRRRINERVESIARSRESDGPIQLHNLPQIEEDSLPTIGRLLTARGIANTLLIELMRAGVKLRPSEFAGMSLGIAILLGLLAVIFVRTISSEALAIFIGLIAPFAWLKNKQAKRLAMFNRQLPDALSLISSSIRSGYSFQRAMQMVADEMPDPISEEFSRVLSELNVGMPVDAALQRMVNRVTSYDIELVVTAILIQHQIGGNLAEIIDNIGDTIRERVKLEGELNALTAEGKISGGILIALPIFLAVVITVVNPGYLKPLLDEPNGIYIIASGVMLQLLGAIIIKKMLVLDY